MPCKNLLNHFSQYSPVRVTHVIHIFSLRLTFIHWGLPEERANNWCILYPGFLIAHPQPWSSVIFACPAVGFCGLFQLLCAPFCSDLDPCEKIVCSYYATCKVFGPNDGKCVCNEDLPAYEDEVCSDDSVTYRNFGFLQKESCLQHQYIEVKKNGSCERK